MPWGEAGPSFISSAKGTKIGIKPKKKSIYKDGKSISRDDLQREFNDHAREVVRLTS